MARNKLLLEKQVSSCRAGALGTQVKAPLDVDTIAILGVTAKGLDGGAVQQWPRDVV